MKRYMQYWKHPRLASYFSMHFLKSAFIVFVLLTMLVLEFLRYQIATSFDIGMIMQQMNRTMGQKGNMGPDIGINTAELPQSILDFADKTASASATYNKVSSGLHWPSRDPLTVNDYLSQYKALEWYFTKNHDGQAPASEPDDHFIPPEAKKIPLRSVLIFTKNEQKIVRIVEFFDQQRIEIDVITYDKPLPPLVIAGDGRPMYTLFLFDDYGQYLSMPQHEREALDGYCKQHSVGIMGIVEANETSDKVETYGHVKFVNNMPLENYKLNADSPIWRVAKKDAIYNDRLPEKWTIFLLNHETYAPLVFTTPTVDLTGVGRERFKSVPVFHDKGLLDGIQRIIFGYSIDYWLNSIVAMDAIDYLTHGRLRLPLERMIHVDIDGVFSVDDTGGYLTADDVEHILKSQRELALSVPGFRYSMGYSGDGYMKGKKKQKEADTKMIELSKNFKWFNHMLSHFLPHMLNSSINSMELSANILFAKKLTLTLLNSYSVPPQHSGVYPVHEPLYRAFKTVGVNTTATVLYPRYRPEWRVRGFIYKGIRVLPRYRIGLFSKTKTFNDIKGGKPAYEDQINGGLIFKRVLFTPILPISTYTPNYGSDRMAPFALQYIITFMHTWTNLNFTSPTINVVADAYFNLYPREQGPPIWTNPCKDSLHFDVWNKAKKCERIPSVLIIGPPGSGVNTLQKFLSAHPNIKTNKTRLATNEDINFFGNENYKKGLDWYMDHFGSPTVNTTLQVEKSTSYLSSFEAPRQINALIPDVKIIILLTDPAKRAYSWYQYQRSIKNATALEYSFSEILNAKQGTSDPNLVKLRYQCLSPGKYARQLARFIYYFSNVQMHIMDGDLLKISPKIFLDEVQTFLKTKSKLDYNKLLRYKEEGALYCLNEGECREEDIPQDTDGLDPQSLSYLKEYYSKDKQDLRTLLKDIKVTQPKWLSSKTGL